MYVSNDLEWSRDRYISQTACFEPLHDNESAAKRPVSTTNGSRREASRAQVDAQGAPLWCLIPRSEDEDAGSQVSELCGPHCTLPTPSLHNNSVDTCQDPPYNGFITRPFSSQHFSFSPGKISTPLWTNASLARCVALPAVLGLLFCSVPFILAHNEHSWGYIYPTIILCSIEDLELFSEELQLLSAIIWTNPNGSSLVII